MHQGTFIGVDWGTSRMRASLCENINGDLRVLATRDGPGVLASRAHIEDTLFEIIAPLLAGAGTVPLLLAGMVGSNIGWRHLPYLQCPIIPTDIGRSCVTFGSRGHHITMVPGLKCDNSLGHPDVMRGEELQVLGWLAENPAHQVGQVLLCLPGTHTKWISVCDGRIESFRTAITGELYDLLLRNSVLLAFDSKARHEAAFDADMFAAGLDAIVQHRRSIMHLLFSVRSRVLAGGMSQQAAPSYLSGLLIGADCATLLDSQEQVRDKVAIIGETSLCELFADALDRMDAARTISDGRQAALHGFASILDAQRHSIDMEPAVR